MKNLGTINGAAVLVISIFVAASAAQSSDAIPKASLSSMGLGSMQVMTDFEGLAIRGMGAFAKSGDHKKPELRCFVDQKHRHHGKGFDHKNGDHKRMDKVSHHGGHKDTWGHKDMRGGSVWHSAKVSWNFGGGFKTR